MFWRSLQHLANEPFCSNPIEIKSKELLLRSKVGLSAWDNPVTMMKTVQDSMEALEDVFRALETCEKGDVKKEELVRVLDSSRLKFAAKRFQRTFVSMQYCCTDIRLDNVIIFIGFSCTIHGAFGFIDIFHKLICVLK